MKKRCGHSNNQKGCVTVIRLKNALCIITFLAIGYLGFSFHCVYAQESVIDQIHITYHYSQGYVKTGDNIQLKVTTKEPVIIKEMAIGTQKVTVSPDPTITQGQGWLVDFVMTDMNISDEQQLSYRLIMLRQSDPSREITSSGVLDAIYQAPIEIDYGVYVNSKPGINEVYPEDEISIVFKGNHPVMVSGNIQIGKQWAVTESVPDQTNCYIATIKVDESLYTSGESMAMDTSNLIINDQSGNIGKLEINDGDLKYQSDTGLFAKNVGNALANISLLTQALFTNNGDTQDRATDDSVLKDEITAEMPYQNLQSITFQSSNANPSLVQNNDVIQFSFQTAESVTLISARVDGVAIRMETIDQMLFRGNYTMQNSKHKDSEQIPFSAVFVDENGHYYQITQEDTLPLKYQTPINLSHVLVQSSNLNNQAVKDGDRISITFQTDRPVSIEAAINNKPVQNTGNETSVCLETTVSSADLNDGDWINYRIVIKDSEGREVILNDKADIRYYAPIVASEISLKSNNQNPSAAKQGDTLCFTLITNHAVTIHEPTINDQAIAMQLTGNNTYMGQHNISEEMTDQAVINGYCRVTDAAGNQLDIKAETPIVYYAPIEVSRLYVMSNNEMNGNKYVKDGDTVSVSLKTNHDVSGEGTIGSSHVILKKEDDTYSVKQLIDGQISDQSTLAMHFNLTDAAGNEMMTLTENDFYNQLTYYAPIEAMIEASYHNKKRAGYVSNDELITYEITANHEITLAYATIMERDVSIKNNGSLRIKAEQNVIASDPEGFITYQFNMKDKAGNVLIVEAEDEDITIDRTKPQIIVMRKTASEKSSETLIIGCLDPFLDESSIEMSIHGGTIEIKSLDSQHTEHEITVLDRDEFKFKIQCSDLSGNENSYEITGKEIDRNGDLLTLDTESIRKLPVVKSGIVVSDIIKSDNNWCEITELTPIKQTKRWKLDEPIKGNGPVQIVVYDDGEHGNQSSITYQCWIDGSPPVPLIQMAETGYSIDSDKRNAIMVNEKIAIGIEEEWTGAENNRLSELLIHDSSGNIIENVLENKQDKNNYEVSFSTEGLYTMIIKTVDAVGNQSREQSYQFDVSQKNIGSGSQNYTKQSHVLIGLTTAYVLTMVLMLWHYTITRYENGGRR